MKDDMTQHAQAAAAVDFSAIVSVEDGCAKLGDYLGLDGPVSRDVFISAVQDPTYATNLKITRDTAPFLNKLLSEPPVRWDDANAHPQASEPDAPQQPSGGHSNAALLGRAAKSLVRWTKGGFQTVDEAVFRHRMSVCAACPNQKDAPATVLYTLASGMTSEPKSETRKVCTLCGCLTANKAKFDHEGCPDRDPENTDLTRWGDPVIPAARSAR